MLAGTLNLTCDQGSTFIRLLELESPDPEDPTGETFEAFDLSGHTARMQIRRTITSSTVMLELTTENGGLEVGYGDVNNSIRIVISAEDTADLTSSGVYDLEIVNDSDEVSSVIQGDFVLNPEVTR